MTGRRSAPRATLAFAIGLVLAAPAGCGADGPEEAADRFVDTVFVRFDQRAGLELATGRARTLLERELRLIGDSRGAGGAGLREQPRVYYERGAVRRTRAALGGERVEVAYRTTTRAEGAEIARDVSVWLEARDGAWKVVEYETREPR